MKWVENDGDNNDNNSSIVIQINYGKKKYLFAGDMETKIEEYLVNEKECTLEEIDVLKVAHHRF